MHRTVCIQDELARRAHYGRIQPMQGRPSLLDRIARLIR
jgi:hypothetical protein